VKKNIIIVGIFAVIVVIGIVLLILFRSSSSTSNPASDASIRVVAAENFYGDIAQQLGGSHVAVTSLLSDPNVDPHEYEASVADGIAISNANVVIKNGLNYDTWMDKLISASPNAHRIVITGGDVATRLLPDNPHVWYGIDNIAAIARSITNAFEQVDPADDADFEANDTAFNNSLAPLNAKIAEIKTKFSGTNVGLTETIYLYQSEPMGLNVITPFNFEKAVAEGNDPSAQDVATTDQQTSAQQIKVLIYNSQTVTPITTNLQNLSEQNNIPIVPVSETMPANTDYQSWMMGEMDALETALSK
jgi:zinc/manganese transport system substrate-binding protein